ncbi:hypothetical protein KIPB_013339 [Kipferlia bialata]|uniref:4Fe-4S ferredoxin-type domain-containing protein n=1 Tax=Kipferlia bialata TaxID=797122 RepID=A0A9K3D8V0_9EUKA|nr:hypothetical protein KIPB_013339 [Kipferlia bialata]|eukprot:g13339.t1
MPLGMAGMTVASFNPPSGRMDRIMAKTMGPLRIDPHKCLRCGQCIVACPYSALEFQDIEETPETTYDRSSIDMSIVYAPRREEVTQYIERTYSLYLCNLSLCTCVFLAEGG